MRDTEEEGLNDSVMSRAVSIIIEAPFTTSVHGPLREKVRARIQAMAPAVTTIAQYTADMGEVELTQVLISFLFWFVLLEITLNRI